MNQDEDGAKYEVCGTLVKILTHRRDDRGMRLEPYASRCVRSGEVHELVTTDHRDTAAGAPIDRVGFLGFAEIRSAGVIDRGDEVWIGGALAGTVLGFDACHYPNHYNVLIAADKPASGPDLGLAPGQQVIFRQPAGRNGTCQAPSQIRLEPPMTNQTIARLPMRLSPCLGALTVTAQPYGASPGGADAAAEAANLSLVRRLHGSVLAGRDTGLLPELVSDEFVQHHPALSEGYSGMAELARFFSAFTDLTYTEDVALAQNNRVLIMGTWDGWHSAQRRRLHWQTAHVYRVLGGKLAEHWAVIDYHGIEPFGFPVLAAQHQPTSPIDWFGSDAQRANLRLFIRFITEMFVERHKEDAGDYLTADFVNNDPFAKSGSHQVTATGVAGFQSCFIWYDWVPDMSFTLDHVVAGEDHVGGLWTWYGTHVSGAPFILHTAEIYRVSKGRMAEHWTLWDFTQLRSFGITPPAPDGGA